MDSKEIISYALQIEKLKIDGSYGSIMTLLGDLDRVQITVEQLETTDIVTVLYRLLKTCSDQSVKKTVRSLLSKWKREYKKDSVVSSGEESSGSAQTCDNVRGEVPSSRDCTPEPTVRSKCVQLLLKALQHEPPDGARAAELAGAIEQQIYQIHTHNQAKYKACVRSKVANLRNPKTSHLSRELLCGVLSADTFAQMSVEEMASVELRQLREEYSSWGVSKRQLPQGVEGTPTKKIRCKRCGGSECTVTHVSRGALFLPAWVRRGGPDEDAMTFVTCSKCGQQWYHSGWICL
ncbi:unnamed protein product [Ophioblennius macclurei]